VLAVRRIIVLIAEDDRTLASDMPGPSGRLFYGPLRLTLEESCYPTA